MSRQRVPPEPDLRSVVVLRLASTLAVPVTGFGDHGDKESPDPKLGLLGTSSMIEATNPTQARLGTARTDR